MPITRMARLTTIERTGRLMKMSVKWPTARLLLNGIGRGVVGQSHGIVDVHNRTVLQLQLTGAHHRVARREAFEHGYLVAAGLSQNDEALIGHEIVLALLVLAFGHDIDRVAVGI